MRNAISRNCPGLTGLSRTMSAPSVKVSACRSSAVARMTRVLSSLLSVRMRARMSTPDVPGRFSRKEDEKCGALAGFAFEHDPSVHQVHELFCNG